MSAKHTPGPWSVAAPEGKYYGTDVLDANGKRVCECWTHDVSCGTLSAREESARHFQNDDERKEWMCDSHYETARDYENARLIAEAPALLEALRAAVRIANEAREEWDKAPNGMRAGKILIALSGGRPGYRADTDAIHAAIAKAEGTAP